MGDFTVQISNDLVDRLLDKGEKLKKKPRKIKQKVPKEPQRPPAKVDQKPVSDDSEAFKRPPAGWPVQPPLFFPAAPALSSAAELEAIQSLLKESKSVVEKLQKQEENIVQEVTQRAKDLRDKEFKLPYQKPMPCLAENNACLECYKEHSKDPLKCTHLVRNFADCARRARQQVSSADK
ncbi:uncharacterized protein LOC116192041 [Punica granatum]|uniref:MICOS complex subunit mic25a-like n=2 Tax=Punica granatum TaxID=22663 RepID=A0A218WG83_PUNGR|nr:uncharacterized protein LOC116192041 [Punica granatum]XP_031376299.1 uncharacterized protein LOC116192041 [Punica granatum]OWM71847.1 hypothetical protein CDL15_Pgr017730 [Punica granatum]PKI59529.1 hypothetical protein CRG98_020057 [Punica granatum]